MTTHNIIIPLFVVITHYMLRQDVHHLSYGDAAVAQRYISNPLLVGGYKCDFRLYVLVTSLLPLTVYIYQEGIVRYTIFMYS